jgi:hypothetical protein
MQQQISIKHILNQKALIAGYDIYEQFADPNRRGGTRNILFIKGKKYDVKWYKHGSSCLIIGETGAECYILLREGKYFDGYIRQWDKSFSDYAIISSIKGNKIIFPFLTTTEFRDKRIDELLCNY